MSAVWVIEQGDMGGIVVWEADEAALSGRGEETTRDTELEAVEYAIACAEDHRDAMSRSLSRLRGRRRTLIRKEARRIATESGHCSRVMPCGCTGDRHAMACAFWIPNP
ncbi:MAG: hypothetical protein K2X91_04040 [Thermoleophilia bacterium]|nr:hypothetical protein [Thermoleophilia bacterium]